MKKIKQQLVFLILFSEVLIMMRNKKTAVHKHSGFYLEILFFTIQYRNC